MAKLRLHLQASENKPHAWIQFRQQTRCCVLLCNKHYAEAVFPPMLCNSVNTEGDPVKTQLCIQFIPEL